MTGHRIPFADDVHDSRLKAQDADVVTDLTQEQKRNLLGDEELRALPGYFRTLLRNAGETAETEDIRRLREIMRRGVCSGRYNRDKFGNSAVIRSVKIGRASCRERV